MAQFGPLSHLVGMTKKKKKKRHQSRTDGNNRGKSAKIVTYCPFCPATSQADPESNSRQVVTQSSTKGSCTKGHTWLISTKAYCDDRYKEMA